jgi:hypothetical protein
MYLHTGWKKFTHAYDVEVGCLVNFFYEGDGEPSVKVFDNYSCHTQYHGNDDSEEDEGQHM